MHLKELNKGKAELNSLLKRMYRVIHLTDPVASEKREKNLLADYDLVANALKHVATRIQQIIDDLQKDAAIENR